MTLLQVALDMEERAAALALARQVAPAVDLIEAGTPLIKHQGIGIVRELRAVVPEKLLVADMKAMDAGGLEATMAFDAGADLMTVLGCASDATVRAAVAVARERDRRVVADLLNVPAKPERAKQLAALGVDYLGVHTGTDDQALGADPLADLAAIRQAVTLPVIVAGGITIERLPALLALEPDIIIAGSAIANAVDPVAAAAAFRAAVARAQGGAA